MVLPAGWSCHLESTNNPISRVLGSVFCGEGSILRDGEQAFFEWPHSFRKHNEEEKHQYLTLFIDHLEGEESWLALGLSWGRGFRMWICWPKVSFNPIFVWMITNTVMLLMIINHLNASITIASILLSAVDDILWRYQVGQKTPFKIFLYYIWPICVLM